MSFLDDLYQGNDYQEVVRLKLNKLFNIELNHNKLKKWVDLIADNWMTCEIKLDRLMNKTWNIFIEYECNKSPSWIFKYDFIHLFCYGNNDYFYVFSWTQLKNIVLKLIETKKYRVINAGDWFRSRWILIPEVDLIANWIAVRKIYI